MTKRIAPYLIASVLFAVLPAQTAVAFDQSAPPAGAVLPEIAPGIEIKPGSLGRGTGVQLTLPGAIGGDSKVGNGLGLGSIGVLPKLDFGLELLYGAQDQPAPDLPSLDALPDSLTLHGSVKKTF